MYAIFHDFSGYSDMAVGLARMMNFEIPINFNAPYRATSLIAFWQRWHMSLTGWLTDYVFNTPEDPLRSRDCVVQRIDLIRKNREFLYS